MKKTVLECPYCKSDITEDNQICPKCGADCKDIIKKYKQEKEEEREQLQKENREKIEKIQKDLSRKFKVVFIPVFLIIIFTACFIMYQILNSFNIFHGKKENITGSINEIIETTNYSLYIDKYEVYEYYDNFFKEQCNTKEGYKKIAFHIIIQNLNGEPKKVYDIIKKIDLKADDENLEEVKTKTDESFCKVVQGKASYNNIAENSTILANDKTSGYIGFEVPEEKKNLKFIINDSEIIEIKNPIYK